MSHKTKELPSSGKCAKTNLEIRIDQLMAALRIATRSMSVEKRSLFIEELKNNSETKDLF